MGLKSPDARIGMWTYKQIQIQEAIVSCLTNFIERQSVKLRHRELMFGVESGRGGW